MRFPVRDAPSLRRDAVRRVAVRRVAVRRVAAGIGVAFGSTVGAIEVCRRLVRSGARGRVIADPRGLQHCDVAIVLGAGVMADGRPSLMLYERVRAGLGLLVDGTVDRLLLSGDGKGSRGHDEVTVMRSICGQLGAPGEALLEDREGLSTAASCVGAVEKFGIRHAVIVTQRFHADRAAYLAHRAGLDATVLALPDRARYGRRVVLRLEAREVLAQVKAVLSTMRR